jgi:hypothetical protein
VFVDTTVDQSIVKEKHSMKITTMPITNWMINKRLFSIGDRMKVYKGDKWWRGTVDYFLPWRWKHPPAGFEHLKKIGSPVVFVVYTSPYTTYDDYSYAYMFIRTDEKIGADDDMLNCFGYRISCTYAHVLREHEEEYTPPPEFVMTNTLSDDLPF